MSTLARLLRLRWLLEEKSRIDLERLAQQASRIDRSRKRETGLASASRREAFSLVVESDDKEAGENADAVGSPNLTAKQAWMAAMTDGEIAIWREHRLDVLAQVVTRQLEAARDEMFERHKERQQAETAFRHEAAERKVKHERRRQSVLDDWFAAMRSRRRRQIVRNSTSGS